MFTVILGIFWGYLYFFSQIYNLLLQTTSDIQKF